MKSTPPPAPPDQPNPTPGQRTYSIAVGRMGHITSELDEFDRFLDAVEGGWTTCIGTIVAAGLVEIGSRLFGSVVFEGQASMHRQANRQTGDETR